MGFYVGISLVLSYDILGCEQSLRDQLTLKATSLGGLGVQSNDRIFTIGHPPHGVLVMRSMRAKRVYYSLISGDQPASETWHTVMTMQHPDLNVQRSSQLERDNKASGAICSKFIVTEDTRK